MLEEWIISLGDWFQVFTTEETKPRKLHSANTHGVHSEIIKTDGKPCSPDRVERFRQDATQRMTVIGEKN